MQTMWREEITSLLIGFSFATLVMMLDFAMNRGQVLSFWYSLLGKWHKKNTHWLKKSIAKILGYCPICFGLWFSAPAYFIFDYFCIINYFYFLTASQFILINRYG